MYTLYYVPNATSMATHIALEWCSAPYKAVRTNFGDKVLSDLSPIGTAGTLARDDGQAPILQTPAILQYLARSYPEANIGSDGTAEGSLEYEQWLNFLVSDVHHAFHLVFNPARYAIEGNTQAHEAALALCYRNYGILDNHLKNRKFMVGDRKTIVDAYVFPMIRWSFVAFPENARNYPALYAFHDRMMEDPSIKKVLDEQSE